MEVVEFRPEAPAIRVDRLRHEGRIGANAHVAPYAHSEGPAPVSALLSGALLNTAMVGIVAIWWSPMLRGSAGSGRGARFWRLADFLSSSARCLSFARGVERLMAYSSVEHMGVIALGSASGVVSASPARSITCSTIR